MLAFIEAITAEFSKLSYKILNRTVSKRGWESMWRIKLGKVEENEQKYFQVGVRVCMRVMFKNTASGSFDLWAKLIFNIFFHNTQNH